MTSPAYMATLTVALKEHFQLSEAQTGELVAELLESAQHWIHRWRLGDTDAQDIAAETFEKLLGWRLDVKPNLAVLRAGARTITRRVCRARSRFNKGSGFANLDPATEASVYAPDSPDNSISETVQKAIAKLPAHMQEVAFCALQAANEVSEDFPNKAKPFTEISRRVSRKMNIGIRSAQLKLRQLAIALGDQLGFSVSSTVQPTNPNVEPKPTVLPPPQLPPEAGERATEADSNLEG